MAGKKDVNPGIPAKKVALMGILLAITVVTLYAESVSPTGKLSLYVLSSFFSAVVIIEAGIRAAWVFYISSCLLTLILLPNKLALTPYIVFFGIYAIFKYHVEKIGRRLPVYILKLAVFNAAVIVSYLLARSVFFQEITIKLYLWIVIPALQFIFLLYDYVYSLFITYYQVKIKRIIKF
jgi:hypothetical protein